MNLNFLQFIVYVDDINDLGSFDAGSEYILFVFQDGQCNDFFFLRYDLDETRYKEDVIFLDKNIPIISSLLGCEISIRHSVNVKYFDEIIYPAKYKGIQFYIEKEAFLPKISWRNFYKLSMMRFILKEFSSLNLFAKRTTLEITPLLHLSEHSKK